MTNMRALNRFVIFILVIASSCEPPPRPIDYTIARDLNWYPLDFGEKNALINIFTNSLVATIAKIENRPFQLIDVNWVDLTQGLEQGDFPGMLTSITPSMESENKYQFSEPFLLLGPVLVVPIDSTARSLEDLKDGKVGVSAYDNSVLIVQKYPTIMIESYNSMGQALEDLAMKKIDGALVPIIDAQAFLTNLYTDRLKIVTNPLNDKGLRLAVPEGKNKQLIRHFNAGLKKLETSGIYDHLRSFYQL